MTVLGYHASHEQFHPRELLECAQAAERSGFDALMCSDHFHPWTPRQGQSGFAWAWLGAALQATGLPCGVVTPPGGWRYHPTVTAQAAATLAALYPGRFWLAVGSGERLNEQVTGLAWPPKAERNARLEEAASAMRALWAGETVTRSGLVPVREAKLYTLPEEPPLMLGAALTPETAAWLASWADGLITVNQRDGRHEEVLAAFRAAGGSGKPAYLQVHLAYGPTDDAARREAHEQWAGNVLGSEVLAELATPGQFEAAARFVRPGDLDGHVRISADPAQHAAWLVEDARRGFDALFLHQVGRDQRRFVETFGREVLPAVREAVARGAER